MQVYVNGRNLEKAIRILKGKLKRDGLFQELRSRSYAQTRGERRRAKEHRGLNRLTKKQSQGR